MTGGTKAAGFERLADILAAGVQPLAWLAEPIVTADALLVVGAPAKSAKTWMLFDLVLAAATGRPWLGSFSVPTKGPVVLVAPEGGKQALARRIKTILLAWGCDEADVELVLVRTRSVDLTDQRDLDDLRAAVRETSPLLTALDSLYLSFGDVRTSQLTEVGKTLRTLTDLASEHECAVALTHHLAKTQVGTGIRSLSGSGVAEWASTILIGTPHAGAPSGMGMTELPVSFDVIGREIPGVSFTATFRIEGDPTDPTGFPRYAVDVAIGEGQPAPTRGWVADRVYRALQQLGEHGGRITQIGDVLAPDGPLKRVTINEALLGLVEEGVVDGAEGVWWVARQQGTLA